jgi:hypothetical protein
LVGYCAKKFGHKRQVASVANSRVLLVWKRKPKVLSLLLGGAFFGPCAVGLALLAAAFARENSPFSLGGHRSFRISPFLSVAALRIRFGHFSLRLAFHLS